MTCNNCQCNCNNEEDTIEEFDKDKEYAIGEFFKVENDVFKVIDDTDDEYCTKCDLPYEVRCQLKCAMNERKDNTGVQFILYDTLENE